ncbi:MAG: hypothetical protein FWG92_03190 [Leptospirales bacterium]|nr:hypothetical protein [Leptospirales bacterium]
MSNSLISGIVFCLIFAMSAVSATAEHPHDHPLRTSSTSLGASAFNPAICVILNGQYGYFSKDVVNIPGFQTGDNGMRSDKGFSLGGSDFSFTANIDHKLYGVVTFGVHGDNSISLDEAYIRTIGLPLGITIKAGRLLPIFGYMNEQHTHSDDFVDRPLPYRAYLDGEFLDDGIQASVVLPTFFYSEIGGGAFHGREFLANAQGHSPGLVTAYARIGGDIGISQAWRLGASFLHARSDKEGREADDLVFNGKNNLYGIDFKYTFSPRGNNKRTEFALQAEYLLRHEKGDYEDNSPANAAVDAKTSGFYVQAVYKFLSNYRLGYRYTFLNAPETLAGFEDTSLDTGGKNPQIHSLMVEYNTSEFGRFRLQYNNDRTLYKTDNQVIFQYTITMGTHAAHGF